MSDASTETLQHAIRHLHGCESRYVETVEVTGTFDGQTVWQGDVQVFDLIDFPDAPRVYVWSLQSDEGTPQFAVILHRPPVDSPIAAVQAATANAYGSQP